MRRVLFDEDVPRPLRRELPDLDIMTVVEAGWAGVKNGQLLRLAEPLFDAFLTADRNLPYQQNIDGVSLGIVVLAVGSTKLNDLCGYATAIAEALRTVNSGEVVWIYPLSVDTT
jgi:hypothetical protein